MNRNQIIVVVCFIAFYSCELFERTTPNLPPNSFKVMVSKTYANHAIIEWEKATDPENDSISYDVHLNDIVIASNLKNIFILELKDLQSEKSYSGSVTATDSRNNSIKVPFTLSTPINSAPDSFKVTVSKITYDYALIAWVRANDIDNDSLSYSIQLNGMDIASKITNQYSFECKNLLPDTHYEGIVTATDSKNKSKAVSFNFTTTKKYLKFSKILAIAGYTSLGAYSIDKTTDGGYILGCEGLLSPQWNFVAIKTDSLANIEWYSIIPEILVIGEVRVRQTNDNGYALLGLNMMIKLNSAGKLVWQYTRSQNLSDGGAGLASFVQTPDNGYIAVGTSLKGINPTTLQASITKLNADGVIQWEKYIGTAQRTYGIYIEKANDGNYVILGSAGNDDACDAFVIKMDGDGNLLWNQLYPNAAYIYNFPRQIKKTNDNGFVIIGFTNEYYDISNGRAMKIDKEGTLIWDKYFSWDKDKTMTNGIDPTKDSGFAITGVVGYNPQGCILAKVDANGNLKWNRNLRPGTFCSFQGEDIKATDDGGFIVIGAKGCVWGDDGNEQGLWIFKCDPDGNYEN